MHLEGNGRLGGTGGQREKEERKKGERRGKRVKHNCKHTEWEDKTIGMRA